MCMIIKLLSTKRWIRQGSHQREDTAAQVPLRPCIDDERRYTQLKTKALEDLRVEDHKKLYESPPPTRQIRGKLGDA